MEDRCFGDCLSIGISSRNGSGEFCDIVLYSEKERGSRGGGVRGNELNTGDAEGELSVKLRVEIESGLLGDRAANFVFLAEASFGFRETSEEGENSFISISLASASAASPIQVYPVRGTYSEGGLNAFSFSSSCFWSISFHTLRRIEGFLYSTEILAPTFEVVAREITHRPRPAFPYHSERLS